MTPAAVRGASTLPRPPLLLITDRHQSSQTLPEIADAAFRAGGRWLLFRDKDLPFADRMAMGRDLAALARAYTACFSVSGDVGLAGELGVDGMHIAADGDVASARRALGDTVMIGQSTHDLDEARRAQDDGADYVTLSPIFASASKPGYGPIIGADGLARIVRQVSVPVFALAGISGANAASCLAAGAAGVAVMGEVMRATEPGPVMAGLIDALMGRAPVTRRD